jgi:hypothetical protein
MRSSRSLLIFRESMKENFTSLNSKSPELKLTRNKRSFMPTPRKKWLRPRLRNLPQC